MLSSAILKHIDIVCVGQDKPTEIVLLLVTSSCLKINAREIYLRVSPLSNYMDV